MSGNSREMGAPQRRRGWWRRNWLWFVPTFVLLAVLIGTGAGWWFLFGRVFHAEAYQSAMQAINSDEGLRQELGEPIKTIAWPPPSVSQMNADELLLFWEIEGPKGHAKVHLDARPIQGKMEIRLLEVKLPKSNSWRPLSAGGEGEAPVFHAAPGGPKKSAPSGPAPQINLPIPPGGGPGG